MTLRGPNIAADFKAIVEDYIARRFAGRAMANTGAAE
jgi:(E)-4-hydroxy-3-methylbut-2-enyl-diphosphate synthase